MTYRLAFFSDFHANVAADIDRALELIDDARDEDVDHLGIGWDNIGRGIAATILIAAAYVAAFITIGLLLRRALVAGIIYILVWEGAIATIAPSAERFSLTAWGRAISDGGLYGITTELVPTLAAPTGIVSLLVVFGLAILLAGWRLGRMDLP